MISISARYVVATCWFDSQPHMCILGMWFGLNCEVFIQRARPLNLAVEAVESMLLVIGSSRCAWWRLGRSSIGWDGMLQKMSGWEVIWWVTPSVNSFTCLHKYKRKASLCHRPSNIIVDVRTLARKSNIAALVRSEWVPTLLMSMPRRDEPIVFTVDLMCWQICFDVNLTNFPLILKVLTSVLLSVPS